MDSEIRKNVTRQPQNPRQNANILSYLTFFYMFKMIKFTNKKSFDLDNIYQALPEFRSEHLGLKFERLWLQSKTKLKGPRRLLMILVKMFYKKFLRTYIFYLVSRILLIYCQPILVGKIVAHFSHPNPNVYYLGCALIFIDLFYVFAYHQSLQTNVEICLQIAIALSSMIYRKTLRLKKSDLMNQSKIGNAITLITKDVFCFETLLILLSNIILVVIVIIVQLVGSSLKIGWIGIIPALVTIFLTIMEVISAKLSWRSRLKECFYSAQRLTILKEVFSMMRFIKISTWDTFFIYKIDNLRKKEVFNIAKILAVRNICMAIRKIFILSSFLISALTYTAINKHISAETLYYLLSSANILKTATHYTLPTGIAGTAEVLASLRRLANFLSLEDQDVSLLNMNKYTENPSVKAYNFNLCPKNCCQNWQIDKGLVIVSGPTNQNNLLAKSIAGEFGPLQGLQIRGSLSFVDQDFWLFPGTIKQNILFGQDFKRDRYEEVIKRCALLYDFDQFENGDETLITNEGISLSTGQQMRIQLARAIYQEKQIYLFNSILNCVDVHTRRFIFQKVFKEFLRNKICILFTDNSDCFKHADKILILKKEAVVEINNSYQEKPKEICCEDYSMMDKYERNTEERFDESSKLLEKQPTKYAYKEFNKKGRLIMSIYKIYSKFAGGIWTAFLLIGVFGVSQVFNVIANIFTAKWVNIGEKIHVYSKKNISSRNSEYYQNLISEHNRDFIIYLSSYVLYFVLYFSAAVLCILFTKKASKNIHKALVRSVLGSKMNFFCRNPIGVILNRFSRDMNNLDELLPCILFNLCSSGFDVIGVFIMIALTIWIALVPITVLVCGGIAYMKFVFLPVTTKVKRIESALHSPMVGYLNGTLKGLTTIKLLGRYDLLVQEYDYHQDRFSSAVFIVLCTQRLLKFVLHLSCFGFLALLVFYFIINGEFTSGEVGLGMGQFLGCSHVIIYILCDFLELEAQMTSLERISDFINLDQESSTEFQLISQNWPTNGSIELKNLNLIYESNQHVLKDINLQIKAHEKVAIVGRTGSGKSSLINCLFRLFDYSGDILIDGVDIKKLEIKYLRKQFGFISNDSLVFPGTLRENLDPFGQHSDAEILSKLKLISNEILEIRNDFCLNDHSQNLLLNEKLLISFVRILLAKPKIILLDEVNNLHEDADLIIDLILKKYFVGHTVIIVSHSLGIVKKMDRVCVLKAGQIIEFDSPDVLLENPNSEFAKMVSFQSHSF